MKSDDGLSDLDRDFLYGLEHGLFTDDLGRKVQELFVLGLCDDKVRGTISSRVKRHRRGQAMRGTPFDRPRLDRGEMILGFDADNADSPIRIPVQWLSGHCLMVATTGAGKTTRSRFYALQLARLVRSMWLFDLRKAEWRILSQYLARVSIDLIIVPGRMMKLNPLQVPYRVDPADWCANVADMLVAVLELPPRTSKLIQTTLFRLYRRSGVIGGGRHFSTLFDLRQAVAADRSANPQSRSALVDSLDPVLHSLGPDVLGYRVGWSTNDLARHSLAFEFAGLAETDKNLLLNTLLLGEFTSRVAQGLSNVPLNLWICMDEAQRLCAASGHGKTSAVADYIALTRGVGLSLDLGLQSTHGLAPQVLSNTNLKMIGRCGSFTDLTAAGGSMGLSTEQVRYAQQRLETGCFITQIGSGSFRRPFVCRIPPLNLRDAAPAPGSDPGSAPGTSGGVPDLGPLKHLPIT